MYYSCINNCDKCVNGRECEVCSSNYALIGDGTSCGSCMAQELNTDFELTMENMDKLVQTYIKNYNNSFDVAVLYSNPNSNYTLAIYRTWQCTETLFNDKYYSVNTSGLVEKLKKKLNTLGNKFVYSILNYNSKSYFEVYDIEKDRKLDMENECPECLRVDYEIKNNYTS